MSTYPFHSKALPISNSGSYSANPSNYLKNFTQLSRSYALAWQDIFVILGFTTTPEEKKKRPFEPYQEW